MKLAIMQPYFLPYLGYFQLMASVDKFVVYDDVSYIKSGWINRNNIKVQGKASLITIPLQNGRSGVPICDVQIAGKREFWSKKMLRTVAESYSKASKYDVIFPMFEAWMTAEIAGISELNVRILGDICEYVGLKAEIVPTSKIYSNSNLSSVDRVLDICDREGATHYINAIGGRELYSQDVFKDKGFELSFLKPGLSPYSQGKMDFIPGLSILDIMMHNSAESVSCMLEEWSFVD
ncbi:WbqC family protein [Opitutales bacterium]|nr:WbqC family protein [Opitutales bacterium]